MRLTFNTALLVLGGILFLLGCSAQIQFQGLTLVPAAAGYAPLLIAAGVATILGALSLECLARFGLPSRRRAVPPRIHNDFLYDADDSRAETFSNLTRDADAVFILARTAINLLNTHEATLVALGQRGCDIRMLFTDPSCQATRYLYGGEEGIYLENITSTARHIAAIRRAVPGIQVRVMSFAPTMSLIYVRRKTPETEVIRVTLYFIHPTYGSVRPMFRVSSTDRWFALFKAEFDDLWGNSKQWDPGVLPGRPATA